MTRNEVLTGNNAAPGSVSRWCRVHPTAPSIDMVRYIVDPFRGFDSGDFAATGVIGNWERNGRGRGPGMSDDKDSGTSPS